MQLLRASSNHFGEAYDYGAITAPEGAESGVAHGRALIALAEAVVSGDTAQLAAARAPVLAAVGPAGLVDGIAVAALFNAIDRVADSTGTQVEDDKAADTADLRAAIGIDAFALGKSG